MTKLIFVLQLRKDIDRAEGLRHWCEEHGALARKTPGLTSYVQQHVTAALQGEIPFDGVAVLDFASPEGLSTAMASAEWQATLADAASFADLERTWAALADEVRVV